MHSVIMADRLWEMIKVKRDQVGLVVSGVTLPLLINCSFQGDRLERELREVKATFALHMEQVGVQITNLSASTSTLFSEQNSHIGNRMSEFLQNLEERPTPWIAVLDDYEHRIKALEERVCKCADTKPWVRGSGTQRDPLELVDEELEYADEPAPSPSSSGYGTPGIDQPKLIDERREDQEVLQVVAPACCAQPSPNPSTQVRGYVARFVVLANLLSLDSG